MLPRRKPKAKMYAKPPERVDSRGHIRWVLANFQCAFAAVPEGPRRIPCGGRLDPHHVRLGSHTGMAQKPGDDCVVPMCRCHHDQLDGWNVGQISIEEIYGIDLGKMAADLWRADTYQRAKWEKKMKEFG
jgi:hypothetical protein